MLDELPYERITLLYYSNFPDSLEVRPFGHSGSFTQRPEDVEESITESDLAVNNPTVVSLLRVSLIE